MQHFHFAQLESTSDTAAKMAKEGLELPFLVSSDIQTAGRGQLGRVWVHCPGNLALTLALKTPAHPLGWLPLSAAALICQWFQDQEQKNIAIKWPNDLIYESAKVGGILCESSIQGSQQGPFLIGIGLNLNAAPDLPHARSLDLLLGSKYSEQSTKERACLLAKFILQELNEQSLSQLQSLYRRYSLGSAQCFQDADGGLWQYEDLNAEGAMTLSNQAGTMRRTVYSSSDTLRWVLPPRPKEQQLQ